MNAYSEALDQKYAALALSRRVAARFETTAQRRAFGKFERWALQHAECYWWSDDIASAVSESAAMLPADTCVSSERLGGGKQFGWLWFEKPRVVSNFEPFRGILWFMTTLDGEQCVSLTTYGFRDSGAPEALDTMYLFDKRSLGELETEIHKTVESSILDNLKQQGIELDTPGRRADGSKLLIRFFVAACLWVQQSILATSIKPADRHLLKRIQRIGEGPTEVNIVTLRRKQYQQFDINGKSEPVEWSCRWIVGGHWRNQYHPSTGERVPTWIMPYVKGPEDKPLKAPAPTVFAVTR